MIKLITSGLLFVLTVQLNGAVTEKLAAKSDKIANIKEDIKSGKSRIHRNCKGKCNSKCKCCRGCKTCTLH